MRGRADSFVLGTSGTDTGERFLCFGLRGPRLSCGARGVDLRVMWPARTSLLDVPRTGAWLLFRLPHFVGVDEIASPHDVPRRRSASEAPVLRPPRRIRHPRVRASQPRLGRQRFLVGMRKKEKSRDNLRARIRDMTMVVPKPSSPV